MDWELSALIADEDRFRAAMQEADTVPLAMALVHLSDDLSALDELAPFVLPAFRDAPHSRLLCFRESVQAVAVVEMPEPLHARRPLGRAAITPWASRQVKCPLGESFSRIPCGLDGCGDFAEWDGIGRRPEYCSNRHKQKAYRERKKLERALAEAVA